MDDDWHDDVDLSDHERHEREVQLARDQAVRWLVRREYASRELLRRLRSKGFDDEVARVALDGLAEQGLQDDERFTEEYVRSRRNRGYGPQRIAAELGEHGIGREQVAAQVDGDASDWDALARQVLDKRFSGPVTDRREHSRRERFLRYRGFSAQQVRRAMQTDD